MRFNLAEAPLFTERDGGVAKQYPALSLVYDVDEQKPEAFLAADAETEFETRRRLIRLLGALSYESAAIAEQTAAEKASLPVVAADYFSKDPERSQNAKMRLTADFRTGVFEILCDIGHISHSKSVYQPSGFHQYGYSLRAMYAHGTVRARHPVERSRRTAETLNELRIEDGYLDGTFRTHYFVEKSRVPDKNEMSDDVAADLGYNRSKRKAMIRLTEVDNRGNRDTVTAGLNGVGKDGTAYDTQGVRNIDQEFNLDSINGTALADLNAGIWIRKDLLPGRLVDIVKVFDQGLPVEDAFFGVEGQKGNYETIEQESLAREQRIEHKLDQKVHELALMLLDKDYDQALATIIDHAKNFATEVCSRDESYDPIQLGSEARKYVEKARNYAKNGDHVRYRQSLEKAQELADVIICGGGGGRRNKVKTTTKEDGSDLSSDGDCEFISKECPECNKKNVKTTVRKTIDGKKHIKGSCGCSKIV